MINKQLLQNKLADLKNYYDKLSPLLREDTGALVADDLKLPTIERRFQQIVDAALDINTHLIKELGLPTPDDYQNTFMVLGERGFLPMELVLQIAPSVGLRNLIIHKYGQVNLVKMVEDIKSEVKQYLDYLKAIQDLLARPKI